MVLPEEQRTIPPQTELIGGRVGGEKYVIHNILFKFASDKDRFFGGDERAAAKVANHELKGNFYYYFHFIFIYYFHFIFILLFSFIFILFSFLSYFL